MFFRKKTHLIVLFFLLVSSAKLLHCVAEKLTCIYVSIGESSTRVKQILELLQAKGAMDNTCIVSSPMDDPPLHRVIAAISASGSLLSCSQNNSVCLHTDV